MAEPLLEAEPRALQIERDDASEETRAFMGSLRPFWGRALLYIVLLFIGIAIVWASLRWMWWRQPLFGWCLWGR